MADQNDWFEQVRATHAARATDDGDWFEQVRARAAEEPPLTRERRAPGAPSALDADHHPEVAREMGMSPFSQMLGETGESFGRWSNDNLPALASTGAALATGGASIPVAMGAAALAGGAGAAGREGIRRAAGRGTPKTAEELGLDVAKEGAISGGLSAIRAPLAAAQMIGPTVANNARAISTVARGVTGAGPLAGAGAWYATNNPFIGGATSAVSRAVTSPRFIRGVGNLTTRIGSSPALNAIANVADRAGLGNASRAAAGLREAILAALDEGPTDAAGQPIAAASTVRP
jgi:hypothetical protein